MRWNVLIIMTALFAIGPSPSGAAEPQSRRFVLEVTAKTPGKEQTFRAAIGLRAVGATSGRLEFIEATTPFKKEVSAASLTVLFEALQADGFVLAQLHGELDGKFTSLGSVGGKSGKITDEPWNNCVTSSFGPF